MKNLKLKDLLVEHDYYCHDSNYYSNEAGLHYHSFDEFMEEFKGCDIDMNLVFRWDLMKYDNGKIDLNLYMIKQRKGIFCPIRIEYFEESDVPKFTEYIQPHLDKIKSIWQPFK